MRLSGNIWESDVTKPHKNVRIYTSEHTKTASFFKHMNKHLFSLSWTLFKNVYKEMRYVEKYFFSRLPSYIQ